MFYLPTVQVAFLAGGNAYNTVIVQQNHILHIYEQHIVAQSQMEAWRLHQNCGPMLKTAQLLSIRFSQQYCLAQ
jgi:hypothetical protein